MVTSGSGKGAARSKVRIESRKGRSVLINPKITKAAARARTTNIVQGHITDIRIQTVWQGKKGESLKKGILGMGQVAQIPSELYSKIEKLDPYKLADMYQKNDFVFEVFFSYEGLNETSQGFFPNQDAKVDDVRFLLENYERLYGPVS